MTSVLGFPPLMPQGVGGQGRGPLERKGAVKVNLTTDNIQFTVYSDD
jgi:hypothetical protein